MPSTAKPRAAAWPSKFSVTDASRRLFRRRFTVYPAVFSRRKSIPPLHFECSVCRFWSQCLAKVTMDADRATHN